MKPGEKPAMKMDGMMLNMIRGQMEKQSFLSDACKDVTLVGRRASRFRPGNSRPATSGVPSIPRTPG